MTFKDDDLTMFEADGAAPLPAASGEGYVEHEGARIWYASYGSGAPVILLHGGLGTAAAAQRHQSRLAGERVARAAVDQQRDVAWAA